MMQEQSSHTDQFLQQVERFHTVWNVPRRYTDCFTLARSVFEEVGFGNLNMQTLGDENSGNVTIMLIRESEGQPAVFAEHLAVAAVRAQERGFDHEQTRKLMLEQSIKLIEDPKLREQVMARSLAATAAGLSAATDTIRGELKQLNITDPRVAKDTLSAKARKLLEDLVNGDKKI